MKLAFCLFKFFPYGGLQRDFLRIAHACKKRGHDIHIYTMHWEGETEAAFHLHLLKIRARQNHSRCHTFAKVLKKELQTHSYDVVIGFNKLPHLDIYYAADVCYQARIRETHSFFYRLFPRYHEFVALEQAVFEKEKQTEILLISSQQQNPYVKYYQTELKRFHLLPPGISKDHIAPKNADELRKKMRNIYQLSDDHKLILMVGSGFKTKGLDRAILALASLQEQVKKRCSLFVIGQDNAGRYQQLAKRLNLEKQIFFLGGRSDVPHFLLAADLLIHPAYHENTGTVLLEAIVSGLPVLTTDVCGYAHYVNQAKAGRVLASPFRQRELNQALQNMLLSTHSSIWKQNGLSFAGHADIYDLPEKAVDFIEDFGKNRDTLFTRTY